MKVIPIHYLLILVLTVGGLAGHAQGIVFQHETWAEVKDLAKKENKLIFVDFYTDWCGPCKMMAQGVFPRPEVGEFFNQHFISVKIDAEKGEGIALSKQYNVHAYPTLTFINPAGEVVYKVIGGENPAELIESGGTALNPSSEYSRLSGKYVKGELDKEEFSQYLELMARTGGDTDSAFAVYFSKWPEISEDMFRKINHYVTKSANKAFAYLGENREAFAAIAGKGKVDSCFRRIYMDDLAYTVFPDEATYRSAKEALKKKVPFDEETGLNMDIHYAKQKMDESIYMTAGGMLHDKYYRGDERNIGNLIGTSILLVKDKALIDITLNWAKEAFALKDNSINAVQLAFVYVKENNLPMAEKYFDISLADSKRDNDGLYERLQAFKEEGPKGTLLGKKLPIVVDRPSVPGVVFQHGTWAEVKDLAKKENMLIFVDFYTDWCGPCKMMVKEVFPDAALGIYYNAHFICVKINAEKGEGPALAKKYGVAGYPTLVFTNSAEEIIYKILGETGPAELIDQAKIALTPRDDFETLKEKYKSNGLTREELLRYINVVKAKGDEKSAAEAFDKYFAMEPAVNEVTYKMITNYARTTDNTAFRYLDQHKQEFAAVAGKEKVESYIHRMIVDDFLFRKYPSEEAYQAAKTALKTKIDVNEKDELSMDADHYLAAGDEASYMRCASLLVNRYYYNDDLQISNILGGSYRIVKDPAYLDSTLQWAKRALAIKDNALNNATLALVYNRLHNRELALKYINASLADCKRDGDTYEQRIQLFKQTIEDGKQWGM